MPRVPERMPCAKYTVPDGVGNCLSYQAFDPRQLQWGECDNFIGAKTTTSMMPEDSTAYCTALIMSKIGRYMATTMPPTTTPRNTIITGSINESRFDTAASTSSS
ncbi:MAG: hypothetical protein JWN44_7261 [Myxococcales bacterium]|nr:hypothetical protein [Myxococcales bacterium]